MRDLRERTGPRPTGASHPTNLPSQRAGRLGRRPIVRRGIVSAVAVSSLLAVMTFTGPLWLDVLNLALIATIAALGLDLLLGHTGLVSVGNAAFLGIGAFSVAMLTRLGDVPAVLAITIGAAVCAVVGTLVALPSLRISGLYLGIATLAFHFVAIWILRGIQTAQVGDTGYVVPPLRILGTEIVALRDWFVLLSVVVVLVVALQRRMVRTRPGRALHAIRERPALAAMSGISIWRYKVGAFAYGSALVGLAGGLTAYYIGHVSNDNFTLHLAIEYLAIVIVGGLGSTYGPVVGALFVVALPDLVTRGQELLGLRGSIDTTNLFLIEGSIVGLLVVLVIIFRPRGLTSMADTTVVERLREAMR